MSWGHYALSPLPYEGEGEVDRLMCLYGLLLCLWVSRLTFLGRERTAATVCFAMFLVPECAIRGHRKLKQFLLCLSVAVTGKVELMFSCGVLIVQ